MCVHGVVTVLCNVCYDTPWEAEANRYRCFVVSMSPSSSWHRGRNINGSCLLLAMLMEEGGSLILKTNGPCLCAGFVLATSRHASFLLELPYALDKENSISPRDEDLHRFIRFVEVLRQEFFEGQVEWI